jgi:hypothetical protein
MLIRFLFIVPKRARWWTEPPISPREDPSLACIWVKAEFVKAVRASKQTAAQMWRRSRHKSILNFSRLETRDARAFL